MQELTIISRNCDKITLSYQIHAMTIARTRPRPLNNNPESSDRNGMLKSQPTVKPKRKHMEKKCIWH
jgi:hypothetical protein